MNNVLHNLLPSLSAAAASCRDALASAAPDFPIALNQASADANMALLDAGVAQANDAIQHLQHIASLLLIYRNESPSFLINRFPNDVLAMIFCAASRHDPATMFAVSQTCARWRRLSLRTPEMWSVVSLYGWFCSEKDRFAMPRKTMHPELVDLVLRRSAQAKMTIHYYPRDDAPYSFHSSSLDKIELSLSRLVELDIALEAVYASKSKWLVTTPAPVLQKLALYATHYEYSPVMLPQLFAGEAPSLQVLCLVGLRIPWNPDTFPRNLTELVVDEEFDLWENAYFEGSDDGAGEYPPSARLDHPRYMNDRSIVSVLVNSPNLEVLVIRSCSNIRCGYSTSSRIEPISLPKLRTVEVQNSGIDNIHILKALSVTKLNTLSIKCGVKTNTEPDVLPLLSHFPDIVFDHLAMTRHIFVSAASVSGFYEVNTPIKEQDAHIRINLFCPRMEEDRRNYWYLLNQAPRVRPVENVFTELLKRLPGLQLDALRLVARSTSKRRAITFKTVVEVLMQQPNLQHLLLDGFLVGVKAGGMPLLWKSLASAYTRNPDSLLLGQVQTIQLRNCHLHREHFLQLLNTPNCWSRLRKLRFANVTLDSVDTDNELEKAARSKARHLVWENVRVYERMDVEYGGDSSEDFDDYVDSSESFDSDLEDEELYGYGMDDDDILPLPVYGWF
ncbi:hypothetical protein BXZ70DRAFT_940621 [Cristinia sonorae]|uniref:F-box domain-containing protein n=1 Tax=Cristinia sonorae TaxID=1940300 RepID=A0A8K0UMP6_9AGAR|nr:hypothetical protein BXZ70DRAFT_940621 [Cristinia sonorae]